MQVYNDELYHFGKIGMKWGHRNNKNIDPNKNYVQLKFRDHKVAKIAAVATANAISQIATRNILTTKTNISDGKRFAGQLLAGYLGSLTVANILQDNHPRR
jgi:hypothetical protein